MTTKILSVVFALTLPIRLLATSHCLPRFVSCALAAIFLIAAEAPAQNSTNCALLMNCPSNIVVTSCFNVQEFYSPTASNICCGVNSTVTCNPPSGSIFAVGTTTTVNCTATDCAQNTNFCSFTVTVVPGNCATNYLQVQCPTNIVVGSCTNIQVFYAPTVTDPPCSNWTVVLSPPSGTYFAPNTTTLVDCYVGDYCGLTNDCSFTVTVGQPIVSYTNILQPGFNFVANPLNNPNGNTANILFTNPAGAHDGDMLEVPNCGSNNTDYTVDSSFPTGWANAIDSAGVTPPTVPPGQGVIYQNNSGSPETFVFTGYEDCSPQPSPLCPCGTLSLVGPIYPGPGTYQNITGQSPQSGAEVIIWNGSGFNTNTYNGSTWSPNTPVLAIGQAAYILVPCPTNCITLVCPTNIVLATCSNCVPAFYAATATNVCCHSNVVVQYSLPSGTCFPIGTNTVQVTAYDPDCASTPPVSCSFTVTVVPGDCSTNQPCCGPDVGPQSIQWLQLPTNSTSLLNNPLGANGGQTWIITSLPGYGNVLITQDSPTNVDMICTNGDFGSPHSSSSFDNVPNADGTFRFTQNVPGLYGPYSWGVIPGELGVAYAQQYVTNGADAPLPPFHVHFYFLSGPPNPCSLVFADIGLAKFTTNTSSQPLTFRTEYDLRYQAANYPAGPSAETEVDGIYDTALEGDVTGTVISSAYNITGGDDYNTGWAIFQPTNDVALATLPSGSGTDIYSHPYPPTTNLYPCLTVTVDEQIKDEFSLTVGYLCCTNCPTNCLLVQCPEGKTVQCGASWTFDTPVATSCCTNLFVTSTGVATNILVISTGTVTNGTCPQFITQGWLIEDACGDTDTCSQIVMVTGCCTNCFQVLCPTNKTVNEGSTWAFDPPLVNDCCSNLFQTTTGVTNVLVIPTGTVTNGSCPQYTVTQSWFIEDGCSNSATCSQTVTVVCGTNCCQNCTAPYPENYTVTILPVTNWVVNSLCQGTNTTLGNILPDGNGALNGLLVYIWDPVTQSYLTDFADSVTSSYANGWINGGNESVPPGTGIEIIDTSGVVYTITISGCQPDCPPPCMPGNQWTLVGGTGTNVVLTWTNLFSCPPVCGTEIQIINPTNQVITTYTYMNGAWMPPLPVPLLAVGQAAQVEVNTNLGMVVSCPPGKTVPCGTYWTFDTPVAATCCSQLLASGTAAATNLLIIPTTTVTNGACPQVAITQNWLIVDGCGDSNTCSQTVTVLGCCTNCLQISCATNKIVACGDTWSFDAPDATTCCSNLVYTLLSSNLISSTPCQTVYQGVWQVTDSCSNSAVCTQLVTVVNSGVPILMPGIALDYATLTNAGITFAGGSFNFVNNGNGVQFDVDDVYGGVGDSIGFDGYISGGPFGIGAITISGPVQTAPVTNTGTLHISDGTYQLTGTIQWVDVTTIGTSGVLNLNGVVNLTGITYPGSSSDLQSLVTSGTAMVDLTFQFIPGKTLTQLVATGGATDFSGTIEGSSFLTTPPLITCSTNKTVPCGATWSFDPPVPYVGCCTNWTIVVLSTMTNSLSSSCSTNYTRTWQVSDCCSNTAICSQTVTVQGCCQTGCPSNSPPVIYIGTATTGASAIYKFDQNGNGTLFAANTFGFNPNIGVPDGCYQLALDGRGNLFAPNFWDGTVEEYDQSGNGTIIATGLNVPTGLAFDNSGNLYADEFGNGTIAKNSSPFVAGLDMPINLAIDANGYIYTSGFGMATVGSIYKYSQSGNGSEFAPPISGVEAGGAAATAYAIGLAFDRNGSLYASFGGSIVNGVFVGTNGVIMKYDPFGNSSVFASGLASPNGVACDANGNVYVAEYSVNTVLKIDPSGHSMVFATVTNPVSVVVAPGGGYLQIQCPTNMVINSCTNVQVFYTPTVTDTACTNWTVVCTPPSGSYFAPGTVTTVNCFATDCCGFSNYCDFTITVNCTNCLQIQCPPAKTVQSCSAWSFDPPIVTTCWSNLINAGTTGATNLVIIPVSTVTNGSCPQYTVTQTWLISDGCDDTNTCSQTVTVLCCTNCCGTNAGPRNIEWLQAPAPNSMPLYADPLGLNTNGTWIITNLPCYGRVLITQTFPDNNSPDITYWFLNPNFVGVPRAYGSFQDGEAGYGPYTWGSFGSLLDFYNGHSNSDIKYNVNFYFLDGAPNPCTLYLGVVGLASNTTVTVSQPVVFRAEYDLAANAPGGNGYGSANTTIGGVWGPSAGGTVGTVVGSAYGFNHTNDPSNTGWAVLQPTSPVPLFTLPSGSGTDINGNSYLPTTNQYPCLTLAVDQEGYDGIGFTVGYVCCPTNCLQVECASNKTVQCGQSWMFDPPVVTTCCTHLIKTTTGLLTNILITPTTLVTNGVCPQYITQSWLIQDGCDESAACSQTVTVLCCTNPCLQVICPTNLTLVTCSNCAPLNFAATAIDQCCSNVQIHYLLGTTLISTNYCFPLGASTVQVTAMDGCSNTASCDFTVTVVPGTNCPCLQVQCPTNKTVQSCVAWSFDSPIATTCCTNPVHVGSTGLTNILILPVSTVTNGSCPQYTVTQTWLISDGCDETNVCSQTVTVLCCTNPCLEVICPTNVTLTTCSNCAPLKFMATATDQCCSNVQISYFFAGAQISTNYCFPLGTNFVQVVATDSCTNIADCGFTVTVLPGTNCGCLNVQCPTNKTVQSCVAWSFDPPIATTCCTNPVHVGSTGLTNILILPVSTVTNGTCPQYTVTRTWLVSDGCDDTNVCSQTVTVICCTNCLSLQCPGNFVTSSCINCATVNFFATATDLCCSNVQISYFLGSMQIGTNYCFPLGYSTVNVMASDACSNTASCSFTVTVLPCGETNCIDLICPPEITNTVCGSNCAPVNFAASAVDYCCTNLGISYRVNNNLISTNYCFPPGLTTVSVTATDACGNVATCGFNVTMVVVTNPPAFISTPTNVVICEGTTLSGAVIVDSDEWDNSDDGFTFEGFANGAAYVTNCANYLTDNGAHGRNILICSSDFSLTESNMLNALTSAGYTVTYLLPPLPATLSGYNAVYVGSDAFTAAELAELQNFVCSGGGLYIAAGTGGPGGAVGEAAQWNTILNGFGLNLASFYDGLTGVLTVPSTLQVNASPVMDNVTAIYNNNGNNVNTIVGYPQAQVIASYGTEGLIGVSACTASAGNCGVMPNLSGQVTTSGGTFTQSIPPGTVICNDTNVTLTITNACGSTNITIPVILLNCPSNCISLTCPTNLTLTTCSNCAPLKFAATATDLCCSNVQISYFFAGAQISTNYCFPLGTNFVQVVATDSCTNMADCGFTVTVLPGTNCGCFHVQCPTNKLVGCGTWMFDPPIATTCCTNPIRLGTAGVTNLLIETTSTVTNGVCPHMNITRTWLIVDGCNNSAKCSQTVTVTNCCTNCISIICPTNVFVTTCSNCVPVKYLPAQVTDSCCSNQILVRYSEPSGYCFPPGTNIVTVTAQDGCGNIEKCEFTVTVVQKNCPPIIFLCPTNFILCTGTNGCTTMPDEVNATLPIYYALYNTGVGPGFTATPLPAGALGDPHWNLVSVPAISSSTPLEFGTNTQLQVNAAPGWLGADNLSAWIAPANDTTNDGPEGNYDYQTTLVLPAATTVTISGQLAADDSVVDVLLNGASTGLTISNSITAGEWSPFTITGPGLAGTNTIDFIVHNNPLVGSNPPADNQDTPTGLLVEFNTVTTTTTLSLIIPAAVQATNCDGTAASGWQSIPPGTRLCNSTNIIFTFTNQCGDATTCTSSVTLETCCVPPPSGMVLWLTLDESVGDTCLNSAGYNNGLRYQGGSPATPANGPTHNPGQYVDNSLCFNGNGEEVVVPNYTAIDFSNQNFTLDAWVKWNGGSGTQVMVDHRISVGIFGNTYYGYSWFLFNGKPALQLANGSAFNFISTNVLPVNVWTHLAVTVQRGSATGLEFYVNGAFTESMNITGVAGSLYNTANLWVGNSPILNSGPLSGCMDEIEIFDRALLASEIAGIYDAGHTGKCRPTGSVPASTEICFNDTNVTVTVEVCNSGSSTMTLSVSFNGLTQAQAGGPPAVNGPTVFTGYPASVTLPPYTCTNFNVTITRPPGLTGSAYAYYQMIIRDPYGQYFSSIGKLTDLVSIWCNTTVVSQNTNQVIWTQATNLVFNVTNPVGSTVNFNSEVVVLDENMAPETNVVSLNGLPPGTAVTNPVVLGAFASQPLAININYLDAQPWKPFSVVLLLNLGDNGAFVPVASTTFAQVMPPTAGPLLSAGATNGQLVVTWDLVNTGWTLRSQTSLNGTNWIPVNLPVTPMPDGSQGVTLPLTNTAQFFQLFGPNPP